MKLSVDRAKELHARYRADRSQTLATLAVEVGVTPSGLRKRWLRLGLPLDLARDRGGNLAARERAAVLRADLEAMSAPFHARRKAAGCSVNGLKASVAKAAWRRYLVTELTVRALASEIGCAYTTLRRGWAKLGLDARAARQRMIRRRIEPATFRLHTLVIVEKVPLAEAAAQLGLSKGAADARLKKLLARQAEWYAKEDGRKRAVRQKKGST
jgi:hypothetical protein